MSDREPTPWWRRLLAPHDESGAKALVVALVVALVASTAVTVTSVALKPRQEAHLERERRARLASILVELPQLEATLRESGADTLRTRLVDLDAGTFAVGVDPDRYDPRAAASDPALSRALPPDVDVANLRRRPHLAPVHILTRDEELILVVLPVSGAGYQSTISAYLALAGDLTTIVALTIVEQSDTPGIGSRIEDPAWLALWPGKQIVDATGAVRIAVARGAGVGPHEVDAISGATRTTAGITRMLQFWLGDHGFGPFLARLRKGEIAP